MFAIAAAESSSVPDRAAEKLVEEHERVAGSIVDPALADVFHAGAAALTEHHELGLYETLIALAEGLELPDAVRLLEETRAEEEQALELVEGIGRRLAAEVSRAG